MVVNLNWNDVSLEFLWCWCCRKIIDVGYIYKCVNEMLQPVYCFQFLFLIFFLSLMPLLLLWRRRRWRQWPLSSKRIFSIYVIAIFPRMHQQCIAKGYSYRSNTHLFTYLCVCARSKFTHKYARFGSLSTFRASTIWI